MLNKSVQNYLSSSKGSPFFYTVGDDEYSAILAEFTQLGVEIIRISDYCPKADKFPNLDEMIDFFRTGDVDYKTNKFVLIGLGEYLALRGKAETVKVLNKIKGTTLGSARVVVLLRFVTSVIEEMIKDDVRLNERTYIGGKINNNVSLMNVKFGQDVGLVKQEGVKDLLHRLEDGASGQFVVKTNLSLDNAIFTVDTIEDAYSAIKFFVPRFALPKSLGEDEQWHKLLIDLCKCDNSIDKVFEKHDIDLMSEADYVEQAFGFGYTNWLYFVFWKQNASKLKNPYLKLVIAKTNDFDELKTNTLNAIIGVKHTDNDFAHLYSARKKLLKGVPEEDLSTFISANKIDLDESVYRLTDNTLFERKEIIGWIAKHGIIKELEQIYPALHAYLKKYTFKCGKYDYDLTDYFDKYKRQKVTNKIEDGFEERARESSHMYASLDTRSNVFLSLTDKKSSYLYWIDALGVEYLSYIQTLAKRKGLSIKIDIVRADLPTITGINKGFYDEWEGQKYKESRLDDIKHNDDGGFDFRKCPLPIHLANELDVIESAVNRAASELGLRHCKQFVIASDHGASRLAVLGQHSEKYETDTKGEHSGRCCKYFDGYDLNNAVAENDYVILTDYGRFRGSREANVEVHGGCTLEETVIPIITFSLNNQADVEFKVLNSNELVVSKKEGTVVKVYISSVETLHKVRMEVNDASYNAVKIDDTHYEFILDIKRAKTYEATILDGSNLIGNVELRIKSAVGSANSDFDDLF